VALEQEFTCLERFDYSGARIVFQGVEGAYSQQAMMEYFGAGCDSYHVDTWKDAMEAIKNNEADFAVLPIENSSAGIVSENYDLLVAYDNYIVGEQIIKIEHALLGLPGAELSDIATVYSHPQALMQCGGYLEERRNWEKISLKNTAMAAKKIMEDGRKNQAAIASRITADIYGLQVLDSGIQDNPNNSTRFIIVTGKKVYRRDASRISICFEIPHESGSLYHMLSHFIYNNLNMTNIQSRPIKDRNWEYRFFIDFEGSFVDHAVQNALRGLREETTSLKILGTY
jgi:chorismate mutase/prephenate dehydratase